MSRLAAVAVPTVLLALVLSGCGSKENGSPVPGPVQPANTQSDGAKPTEDTAAAKDVKISKCAKNAYTQDVTIEVTNSTAKPWKYVVGINIKDASGGASEARFVRNRIEPGKSVTEDIPGDTPLNGEVTCEVGEAKRMAAQ